MNNIHNDDFLTLDMIKIMHLHTRQDPTSLTLIKPCTFKN